MAHKIMVAIQKGGVGKSTTTTILAELFAQMGFRVLVIDLDSQGNTTQMLTQESIYKNSGRTILEAIKENNPKEYLIHVGQTMDLLPADDMLVSFSRYIYKERVHNPIKTLENTIKPIESDYDIILMDCPPNLGDIVLNAIVYADYIIIPVKPEAFGKDAVERFIDNIEDAKRAGHSTAEVLGILFTLRDSRIKLEKTVGNDIRERYKNLVFDTEIRLRARLEEYALTGVRMEKKADLEALEDYISLTEEVIERIKEMKKHGR